MQFHFLPMVERYFPDRDPFIDRLHKAEFEEPEILERRLREANLLLEGDSTRFKVRFARVRNSFGGIFAHMVGGNTLNGVELNTAFNKSLASLTLMSDLLPDASSIEQAQFLIAGKFAAYIRAVTDDKMIIAAATDARRLREAGKNKSKSSGK